jgi:hypothetical protein
VLTEGRRIDPRDMFTINTLGISILISNAMLNSTSLVTTKPEGKGNTVYRSVVAQGGPN